MSAARIGWIRTSPGLSCAKRGKDNQPCSDVVRYRAQIPTPHGVWNGHLCGNHAARMCLSVGLDYHNVPQWVD